MIPTVSQRMAAMGCASALAIVAAGNARAQTSLDQADVDQAGVDQAGVASATDPEPAADGASADIVVTASRFGGRIAAQALSPVDVIGGAELARGGRTELQQMLKNTVPSFSTPRPNASGVGDFTMPPTLRGLSTGQLLLLVNGKRRHASGDLSTSNGIGRGDVAYDFNAIPSAAIGSVEVLRDGAAAQYGSDAIAGVINLSLSDALGASGKATYGVTAQGDGQRFDASAGYGVAIGDGGVIRTTVQYQDQRASNRAAADTRQQYFGRNAAGALVAPSAFYGSGTGITAANGTLDAREATVERDTARQGDSPYRMGAVFVNAKLPLGNGVEAYAFGGYSELDGHTPFFFRRAGQDQTVRALHPDGYIPIGDITLRNYSVAGGVRADDLAGFKVDLSTVVGKSLIDLRYSNSNNVSLGAASPTEARMGATRFSQWTTNLDLSREIAMAGSPLKLAAGAEYRRERYRLIAGEPDSYVNGGVSILDGPNAGRPAPIGFQPNITVSPIDATRNGRHSKAIYAEAEKTVFERLTLDAAVRHEDFSDFGDTTNFKFAGRLEVAQPLAVRASYSTGFRAPHLAQSYFGTSNTSFINGAPVLIRILPVDNPAAQLVGASALKPERSRNLSVGGVLTRGRVALTVDAYQIVLKDRIVLSSVFQDPRVTALLAANGFGGIGGASYLTNAVNSRTRGIDVTATYRFDLGDLGRINATLAGNYNKTRLTKVAGTPAALAALGIRTPLFDLTQQVRITDSQPREKGIFSLQWQRDRLSVTLANTYYGKVSAVAFTTLTPAQIAALTPGYDVTLVPTDPASANSQVIQTFKGKLLTDLEVAYDLNGAMTLSLGANNIFDIYPTQNLRSTAAGVAAGTNGADNAGTLPYNAISPFGFNGASFFAALAFRF